MVKINGYNPRDVGSSVSTYRLARWNRSFGCRDHLSSCGRSVRNSRTSRWYRRQSTGLAALETTKIIWLFINTNVCRVSRGGVVNMPTLALSITSYFHYDIRCCMCSTGQFQYRWWKGFIYSSCYYHHQIGSIHLSHCYHVFPWLCVSDLCYTIFCYLLHIHSGKTGKLFSLLLCSLWWVQIIGHVLSWRSYSFVCTLHHLIIIIVQTYLKTLNL